VTGEGDFLEHGFHSLGASQIISTSYGPLSAS
jgi:hypothetical protein